MLIGYDLLQPGASKAPGRFGFGSPSQPEVHIEMSDMRNGGDGHYDETEENKAFQMEWDQRKSKQDEDLDVIEQGLGNLQNIAQDMGSEVNKQDELLDEIDTQVCIIRKQAVFTLCGLFLSGTLPCCTVL